MEVISGIFIKTIEIFREASPYLLFGFTIAGAIHAWFPASQIIRHLGGSNLVSTIKAALIGAPIPLCSCGVVPTALSLRKQGASKSATVAFLISTPETGVDSISITWALMDPLMTVLRPLAAIVTSIVAGFAVTFTENSDKNENSESDAQCHICDNGDEHTHGAGDRFRTMFSYAFVDFLGDIAKWLLIGFFLAGVISYPDSLERIISENLGQGILPIIVMMFAGIPIYICATASTPIAAALVLKGLSPGAALVFLLTGPATNAATITMVAKTLGKRVAVIYLASIAVVGFAMAIATNAAYSALNIAPLARAAGHQHERFPPWVFTGAAILLLALILHAFLRQYLQSRKGASCCSGHEEHDHPEAQEKSSCCGSETDCERGDS
ncbi:SO_0444 family Cu/Zn efflux transporter [Candidatus Hydrogenedentota bacterium]